LVEIESLIPWEIEEASKGLTKGVKNRLLRMRNQDNSLTLARYILSMKHEINISDGYRLLLIKVLSQLPRHVVTTNGEKDFKEITREDFLSFLNSFRKPEPIDPLHKWIGTYNHYVIIISRFFKWLYYPDLSPKERQLRQKPAVIDNIPKLKRKEKSIYKPTDLWTQDDDQLFLKYCPSVRDRCYHMISRDTSMRPHEILGLRIKDVVFRMAGDRQYAEVLVNGKTGSRCVPLINSIPYLKDYLDDHPQRTNPNTYLIFGSGKSYGKRLSKDFVNIVYSRYKKQFFPKLLEDPKISPEDKVRIRELLKKPWNPYIRRHSALTEKSQILKESVLRQYAGWSPNSNMPQVYLHYLGNESNESMLEAYGLKPKAQEIDKMKPRQCPNCNELNKIDSKFCVKCRMVLSYDSYIETINKAQIDEAKMDKIQMLVDRIENLEKQLK
jgi:integrase